MTAYGSSKHRLSKGSRKSSKKVDASVRSGITVSNTARSYRRVRVSGYYQAGRFQLSDLVYTGYPTAYLSCLEVSRCNQIVLKCVWTTRSTPLHLGSTLAHEYKRFNFPSTPIWGGGTWKGSAHSEPS